MKSNRSPFVGFFSVLRLVPRQARAVAALGLVPLAGILLTSCAESNRITGNALVVQGQKLRAVGSYRVQILQAGNKARAGNNFFSPYADNLKTADSIPTNVLTSIYIKDVQGLKTKLSAKGIPGIDQPGIDIATGRTTESSFVIIGMTSKEPLLRALQDPRNAHLVRRLSQERAPRVITGVATTLDYRGISNAKVTVGATADLAMVGTDGSLTVEIDTTRNVTVKFSNSTVFAYEMSIPAWQKDTEGNLYIVDLVPDRIGGFNPKPILESSTNVKGAPIMPKNHIALVDRP
jgi:hypothetical protein